MNMDRINQKSQSAPQCQLMETGTPRTFRTLLTATKELSQPDIEALEEDLLFYAETGLIGVQMSRLLDALSAKNPSVAA